MSKCLRRHLQYFYNASAYGLAGEIERPMRHSIPMQAATALSSAGGRGFQRVENFSAPPYVSFDAAYTEVGGSFDEWHKKYTTFAYSVIEGLNIAGMVTADRIVARMAIYSPEVPTKDEPGPPQTGAQPANMEIKNQDKSAGADEHEFDITGSYFENLRIAGHPINVQLATHHLLEYQKYSVLADAIKDPEGTKAQLAKKIQAAKKNRSAKDNAAEEEVYDVRALQPWGNLNEDGLEQLKGVEKDYHALTGFGARAKEWKDDPNCHGSTGVYWLSAAGHYQLDPKSGLTGFGGIICIPKFGVVRLGEIVVHKHHRHLHMLRVEMCSTSTGNATGGGTGGGGTMPPPG